MNDMPDFDKQSILQHAGKVTYVRLPTPKLGGKIWLLEEKGMFVLEEGPGMIVTMACTHAGSGSIAIIDGIPDENGFFPAPAITVKWEPGYWQQSGVHKLLVASPSVMGSWMLSGGFYHGLTVLADGGTESASVIASLVWMPEKVAAPAPSPIRKSKE